uniref:Uncharacterized protein n=1 Tax=Physcomitrium patens TaxID=3218 RepID=A0A2K1IJR2_PHYPA|nr:hypothetical protein PHYPA_028210 [Physcomitrium patens]
MAVTSPTKSRGADLQFGLYRLSHPTLPEVERAAAQSFNIVRKSVATEKRRQLEAKANAIANEKELVKRREQVLRAGYSAPL